MTLFEGSVSFLTGGAVVVDVIILACLIGLVAYAANTPDDRPVHRKADRRD